MGICQKQLGFRGAYHMWTASKKSPNKYQFCNKTHAVRRYLHIQKIQYILAMHDARRKQSEGPGFRCSIYWKRTPEFLLKTDLFVVSVVYTQQYHFDNEEKVVVSRAGIQNRIGTGSKSVSVLGLKVFEYSGEIRYSHDGSSIKTISHANNWISTNWIPLVSFSWDDESTYGVGTTVAHHIEYCTWSFVHEKLGLTYGTHQVEITGSVKNKTTFSVS